MRRSNLPGVSPLTSLRRTNHAPAALDEVVAKVA